MDEIDIFLTAHFTVATLPLAICFILALRDIIQRRSSNPLLLPYTNRWTGYGGLWMVTLLIIYCCAWIAFIYGGCSGGVKHTSAKCSLIPDAAGQYASVLMFFGYIYLVTTLMPAFVLFAAAELSYRLRRKLDTIN